MTQTEIQSVLTEPRAAVRWRFALLFAVNVLAMGGIRACDANLTIGYPVVATVYGQAGTHTSFFNWGINAVFAVLVAFALAKLAQSLAWRSRPSLRVGARTALGFLIYGNILIYSRLADRLQDSAADLGKLLGGMWLWPVLIGASPFENIDPAFVANSPLLTSFFPHADDLQLRLGMPFALLLVGLLGGGVSWLIRWWRRRHLLKANAVS